MQRFAQLLLLPCIASSIVNAASAQCETRWSEDFDHTTVAHPVFASGGAILASTVFDDGSGGVADLYVCGDFVLSGIAGSVNIARYDGDRWHALGSGISVAPFGDDPAVRSLLMFDDGGGAGQALYAGGTFSQASGVAAANIARWDGSAWSALGEGLTVGNGFTLQVNALAAFDDGLGDGSVLYAAGFFSKAGTVDASSIARWDGVAWSALGSGIDGTVNALCVFDDGDGPALYVGGGFTQAGGINVNGLARWDGTAWSALGSGLNGGGAVHALHVHDAGSGPQLYVGGSFPLIDGVAAWGLARFDGTSWSALASGTPQVRALATHDDGSGAALYVGGFFPTIDGVPANNIARWNGASFVALDTGVGGQVNTLVPFDDGTGFGASLFVAGGFSGAGGQVIRSIAKWQQSKWSRVGDGLGLDSTVRALVAHDDGSGAGPCLFAAGSFKLAGGVAATNIARFDGRNWKALGTGIDGSSVPAVHELVVYDEGAASGPALFALGSFLVAGGVTAYRIARWDGASWSAVGPPFSGASAHLKSGVVFDDGLGGGPALYVSGTFTNIGSLSAGGFARWDGSSWSSPLFGQPVQHLVYAADMLVFDDGSGPALYAAGQFVGGYGVGRFDGRSWTMIGAGVYPESLASFDDGNGAQLYVGGSFDGFGGVAAGGVARWDGTNWSSVGVGFDPPSTHHIYALLGFDDGNGAQLFATGSFNAIDGSPAGTIARWNGTSWIPFGRGSETSGFGLAFATYDAGGAEPDALFLGGSFATIDGVLSSRLARWSQDCPGRAFCTGDDLAPAVTRECPCGNAGAPGHGCGNSFEPQGALLATSGSTAADEITGTDTVILHGSLMPPTSSCTYIKGNGALTTAALFGDGVRCIGGNLIRLASKPNVDGISQYPEAGDLSLSERGLTPIGSGVTAYYQTSYRNATSFCTSATFNISSGVKIVW